MAKDTRYSTFKKSSTRGSWTIGKMTQRLASIWLLECCCGSCYAKQKTVSCSELNDANEMDKKKNLESIIKSQISTDFVKSKNNGQVTEEIPLTNRDYGVSKDDEFLTFSLNRKEALLANYKDDSLIDTSDSRSKSSFDSETLSASTKRVIGSLPILKKEKKSPSVNDGKKASQSDSELAYPTSIFAKCSKRYRQQKVSAINIPELIIS